MDSGSFLCWQKIEPVETLEHTYLSDMELECEIKEASNLCEESKNECVILDQIY